MQKRSTDLRTTIGFDPATCSAIIPDASYIEFINMSLSALGEPIYGDPADYKLLKLGQSLMAHYSAKDQLRDELRPPVDQRIEDFLARYLDGVQGGAKLRLPGRTFILGQHGLARTLSLPPNSDRFESEIVESFRVSQGVLHNPRNDRRTTKGVFHVAEGGLPIPEDKKAVPRETFACLFEAAVNPPRDWMRLPFTSAQADQAHVWVSLLLRPVVCPGVPGFINTKSMEVRFFAPGSLVCNLDFVESIFGNAGDPYLRENDAGLDVVGWSGHTGCVILAPHLTQLRKKDLGLPHVSKATERQKRDGMCWENEDERYNDGGAFKITARDASGVIVTLIADNYFGYCKKEVKTQIGFAANLMGLAEEEHAGGAVAFASYDLGEDFRLGEVAPHFNQNFASMVELYGRRMQLMPGGYAVDINHRSIIYVPEDARFNLHEQRISWKNEDGPQSIKLLAGNVYVLPSGYKVELIKPAEGRRWRLIGTAAEATMCHKPCTVSGGGKSEISKPIADAIIHAPFYVQDIQADFDQVDAILNRDYTDRFVDKSKCSKHSRSILSRERSLGSVIKLLTPSEEYTDEHNEFVRSIPTRIKGMVLLVKRFYKEDWGKNWRNRFSVDIIDGEPGHELKYRDNKVITSYLRLGFAADGSWRVFGLRKDFAPARKIQMEDDITASVVVPRERLKGINPAIKNPALKCVQNCEFRLFQRPDDAIIRGYDRKTEEDLAKPGNFLSNYQPITRDEAREMTEDAIRFDYFSQPMRDLIRNFVELPESQPDYVVSSANPRIVDGKPSKNPRFLQTRPDLETPRDVYLARVCSRLFRKIADDEPVLYPVNAVLPGRRNNPPEPGIRSLAVFNPIHYMPLPEAFMEFISSMTGKSPSTTGAGSEGALTKGPFNALLPISDLNNAFVAFAMTGYQPFVTAAGYVGPKFRVDHDISLLVPEIWSRMRHEERDPQWLIDNGYLEPVPDMLHNGKPIPSSILGFRINQAFVNHFLGRIFFDPSALFREDMLKPELQDMDIFADGIDNILATHKRVALNYFEDGSIDRACPPLKALLHIMAHGSFQGLTIQSPELRRMFTREAVIESDWLKERYESFRANAKRHYQNLAAYLAGYAQPFADLEKKRKLVADQLAFLDSPEFETFIHGTIGRDPIG